MGKDIFEHFNSITSFMKALEERKENNSAMSGEFSSKSGSESFTGTKSYDEAADLLKNGWTEKLEEVKQKFSAAVKANANASTERVRPTTGIVGYAPCVPNAIRGLPNSMITSERTPQKVKAVSLVYGTTVNSEFGSDELIKCGVVIMQIVNSLELSGYRVKLVQELVATGTGSDTATAMIDLKDYRQPLDLKKLCFPMIHSSMFRRLGFKWLETVPNLTNRGFSGGYGSAQTSDYNERKEFLKEKLNCLGDKDFYLTAYLIRKNRYDVTKVMEAAGMASLNK